MSLWKRAYDTDFITKGKTGSHLIQTLKSALQDQSFLSDVCGS